jgi:3-phenylpropionate/trans-cinnamate dioxygenase ferredoxin subunit/naphthalene 1,2-dioxygenase system ferredoxin subunit
MPARLEVDAATPEGTILPADLDGAELALIRHARGWAVTDRYCPHARCSLVRDGEVVDGSVLVCNCHGSEFDLLTGEVLLDPADRPLRLHRVEPSEDGSHLIVEL